MLIQILQIKIKRKISYLNSYINDNEITKLCLKRLLKI